MMSLGSDVLNWLSETGSEVVWLVKLFIEPLAFLTVEDYTQGSGDDVIITIQHPSGPTVRTYTEGVDFVAASSNAATAENIAEAIRGDTIADQYISAFRFGDIVAVLGKPFLANVYASTTTGLSIATSDGAAWISNIETLGNQLGSGDGGPPYKFVSGDNDSTSLCYDQYAIPEVANVRGVSSSIDPLTRQFSIGDVEIEFEDRETRSVLRTLLFRTLPKGRRVDILIGTRDMDLTIFVPIGSYVVDEIIPSRGVITMTCKEVQTVLSQITHYKRILATEFIFEDADLGTGVSVTVTWRLNDGTTDSFTLTEGVDWIGNGTISTAGTTFGTFLRSYITSNGHDDYMASSATPGTAIIYPVTQDTGTQPLWDGRIASIHAVSSDATIVKVYNDSDTWHRASGGEIAPNVSGCIHMWPPEMALEIIRQYGITNIDADTFQRFSHTTVSHVGITCNNLHVLATSFEGTLRDNSFTQANAKAIDLVEQLCFLLQGGIWTDELGKISFLRRSDPTRPIVRHLTPDDWDEFEWLEQYRTLVNRIKIYGIAFGSDNNGRTHIADVSDLGSLILQSQYGDSNPEAEVFETYMFGNWTGLNIANVLLNLGPTATSLEIPGPWHEGFSGTRFIETGSATQNSYDRTTSIRPSWYIIWQHWNGFYEVVEATANAGSTGVFNPVTQTKIGPRMLQPSSSALRLEDPAGTGVLLPNGFVQYTPHDTWTINGLLRGQWDTPPTNFALGQVSRIGDAQENYTNIIDVTIPKYIADHYMSFSYGVPMARFRCNLRQIELQVGDVITHSNTQYLNFLQSGTDENTTWEIVSKEIDYPWVVFTIARLSDPNDGVTPRYSSPSEIRFTNRIEAEVITTTDLIPVTDSSFIALTRN